MLFSCGTAVTIHACGMLNAPFPSPVPGRERPGNQLIRLDRCFASCVGVEGRNFVGEAGLLPPLLLALLPGLLAGLLDPGESSRFGSGLSVSRGGKREAASSGVDERTGSKEGVIAGEWRVDDEASLRLGVEVETRISVESCGSLVGLASRDCFFGVGTEPRWLLLPLFPEVLLLREKIEEMRLADLSMLPLP